MNLYSPYQFLSPTLENNRQPNVQTSESFDCNVKLYNTVRNYRNYSPKHAYFRDTDIEKW